MQNNEKMVQILESNNPDFSYLFGLKCKLEIYCENYKVLWVALILIKKRKHKV